MRVIYFTAQWCSPCQQFKPIVQKIASELGIQVDYVDIQTNNDLVSSYQITSVPTLIGERNGNQVFRHTGITTESQIKSMLTK